MATTDFQFVIGDRPEQLKASRLKSHISKRGWAAYRASLKKNHVTIPDSQQGQIPPAREDRRNLKPRRSSKQTAVTYELTCGLDGESPRSNGHSMPPGHRQRTLAHPIEYQLGGGRIDPFQAHAGQRGFHVPALVDHCNALFPILHALIATVG